MGTKKLLAATAGLIAGTLVLSACTPQPAATQTNLNTATTVNVMWNQPFYSYNNVTTFGNATANANIVYLTADNWLFYDKGLNMVPNESYGKYEKLSDNPLTIKMTLADTATWSDGTPVTAADVILDYGAVSGLFNTVTDPDKVGALYNEDGTLKANAAGSVYFDASSAGLALIKDFPVIGDNNKSVTITYSKPFADWQQTMTSFGQGLPAHIVAKRALGEADPAKGAQAIIDAFKNKDGAALSKISNVWNQDWNFTSMPADKDLLVSSGAYVISEFKEKQYLTMTKNPGYKGSHPASIDSVTVRFNEDPMAAVQALQNGEVQLISPQATADVLKAAQAIPGVTVSTGDEGTFEHVDLTFNNGGPFDPKTYGGDADKAKAVRQAFLLTLPRQTIIDNIIKPINPEAAVRNSFNVVPGSPNYDGVVAANGMSTAYAAVDLDKAKSLLEQAGVKGKPKVRVLYAASNVRRQQEFRLIKESADQAGFEVVDNGSDTWGEKLGDKSYDASLFGWQSVGTAVTESDANFRTGGVNNFGGYSNKAVDALYDQLLVAIDPAQQKTLNEQIEKTLVDDAFGVSIFQFPNVTVSSKLTGIDPIPISPTIFWNFWEWKNA